MIHRAGRALLCLTVGCGSLSEPAATEAASEPVPLVGFLIEDGVYGSELTAPLDVLHHTPPHAPPGLRVCTIAPSLAPIRSFEGLEIKPDFDYGNAPPLDVLVVPSATRHVAADFADPALVGFVRERATTARFVVSLCDGAFVLGAAGLLDDRTCTTFPGDSAALRERFPAANVVDNVSFVVDGNVITAVGGARSYEPALYLVERLFGAGPARGVGRGLVIDWDLRAVPHLVVDDLPVRRHAYRVGDSIDPSTFVETAAHERERLLDSCGEDDRVLVVVIFGGMAKFGSPPRAGLWCEDSLNELGMYRHLQARFEDAGAAVVGVACPPLHHEERFGFEAGSFRPGGSTAERAEFVRRTEDLRSDGLIPFARLRYDLEFRLLRNLAVDRRVDGEPAFVGRFRPELETQEYGTPCVWILSRDGKVLAPPFFGNNWEKSGTLRHTSRELEAAIARALEITAS